MLSKNTQKAHQEQSKEWWLLTLQKKSLRQIAAETNLSYSSVYRRMIKFYGKDYKAKAKSSLVRSLSETIATTPKLSGSERKKQEVQEWLNQNIGLLAKLDSECPNNFISEADLENQRKRNAVYDQRDDYNRYFQ